MPVSAVLLDADGVVQQNPPGWVDAVSAFVDRGRGDEFTDDLFATEHAAMLGRREFPDVVAEVAARWGIPEQADSLLRQWERIDPVPDTLELVRELRGTGVRCYLVSNQNAFRAAFMQRSLGYDRLFDGAFYSCDLGVLKSSERFFDDVLERLAVPRDEVVLVDDKEEYVAVARRCGVRAVCWSAGDGIAALRSAIGA